MLSRYLLPANRKLRFHITECNAPPPYYVEWKVCNVGREAEQRNMIRGQIVDDQGNEERVEPTSFDGDHFVE